MLIDPCGPVFRTAWAWQPSFSPNAIDYSGVWWYNYFRGRETGFDKIDCDAPLLEEALICYSVTKTELLLRLSVYFIL